MEKNKSFNFTLSCRAKEVAQSEIRAMSIECTKVEGINLAQGICDLPLPSPVRNGATDAINSGKNIYTRYDGIYNLRRAISKKCEKFNNIKADPEKNIVVTSGSTGAFYIACLTLLNPGDEFIIFQPYYSYHVNTLLTLGITVKYVNLYPPMWKFKIDELESVVTQKTKAIMINTPSNPCGKVFSEDELHIISDFAIKNDIIVFTDEIYEYFVYNGNRHISPASLPELRSRTITISGYSKSFFITGWRIGYIVCPREIAEPIGHMSDLVYVCAPAPLQRGVARGIDELSNNFYNSLSKDHQIKRDKICQVLTSIGLTPYVPDGAYYVLADVSKIPGKSSHEKALYILDKTKVASVAGSAFYSDNSGDNLVRFCFAKDHEELDEACNRLQKLS